MPAVGMKWGKVLTSKRCGHFPKVRPQLGCSIPLRGLEAGRPVVDLSEESIYYVDTLMESDMQAFIRKWGNSPALRLPSAALKEAGYVLEQKVELIVSRSRIVIQPSENVNYSLDDLLAGITAGNEHGEVSFGPPVGKETF